MKMKGKKATTDPSLNLWTPNSKPINEPLSTFSMYMYIQGTKMITHTHFQGGPGSVRFGYGLGVEGFVRFRFSVLAVPLQKVLCVSAQFNREGRFRFRFRFRENGSGGSGSAFGSGKNGSDGSGFRLQFGSRATLHFYDFGINFPIAQDICYTGLSGRNSFV